MTHHMLLVLLAREYGLSSQQSTVVLEIHFISLFDALLTDVSAPQASSYVVAVHIFFLGLHEAALQSVLIQKTSLQASALRHTKGFLLAGSHAFTSWYSPNKAPPITRSCAVRGTLKLSAERAGTHRNAFGCTTTHNIKLEIKLRQCIIIQ